MKILITGGTGFLGRSFLRRLMDTNGLKENTITVLSSGRTQPLEFQMPNVSYIKIDLAQDSPQEKINGMEFDVLIHLATSSTLGPSFGALKVYNDIINIDKNVLRIAKNCKCGKLIWASSGAVYGRNQIGKPSTEDEVINIEDVATESAYRIGKIQSEFHVLKFAEEHDINLEIIRLFTFSGIDLPLNVHFALGDFISSVIARQEININGTGKAIRSYLDQVDFSEILLKLVTNTSPKKRILNVGSPFPISLEKLALVISEEYQSLSGLKSQIKINNKILDSQNYYVPSMVKLIDELKIEKFIDIQESVSLMLRSAEGKLKR